ncbi:MarR family transcriptional regulator [Pseudomonas sp. JS3066]|jgi:DNA-binding MarR family transcriptional regulator|uniref:MarR family winged helix-turn-helix transcriptional regulator n=1 Tax=unclassified Pseudomonas TaxID=196821 RepID=UPI000EA9F9A2|nr:MULTISPECIES: MarR family transcriptional regulator [unclassified Pseudomonas]AYF86876.1 MarR family transcriptional regulator [Pseudomonas sp. DY-1]MDH4652287.1 MarR family transcriptional regulator [Pseudomonas sp. BN606]MRK24298.1 MarR family transcriptional regulator [Pseudomonas sp. JG-B]WVK95636.1 MarR family transcriptional regulator [Pseudomonas sp. JS3066]
MPRLEESIGFLLADASRLMRRSFEQHITGSSLTLAQARALAHVARNEGCRQVELADQLEVKPITLARLLDQLEQAELVERRPDPDDRRAYRLYLRPRADKALDDIRTAGAAMLAVALDGFSEAETAALSSALRKMRSNLSSR